MKQSPARSRKCGRWLVAAALLLACGAAHADDAEGPRQATPSDPDAFGAETVDPEALEAGTRDPDSLAVETDDPEDHEGRTYGLDEVPVEPPDPDTAPRELPGQDEWAEADDPDIAAARAAFREAQARADQAVGSYRKMIRRNYPRGDARAKIVRERNEALKALERAEAKLRRLDPSLPAKGR